MRALQKTALFGTRRRTEVLVLLALLGESYPRELARLLNAYLGPVQKILERFEAEAIVVSSRRGTERRYRLNPRYYAVDALERLLLRLGEGDKDILAAAESVRMRPRRRGKQV